MTEIPEDIIQQIDVIRQKCVNIKPRVAIHSLAYNHGPYIQEALDGFIKQQTDFPFVAIVHDDASTDNTAEILKEYADKYPNIIFPLFEKENQYSKGNGAINDIMVAAIKVTGAEYISMCECDDYWIENSKLQIQANYLDNNKKFGMCYSFCKILENTSINTKVFGGFHCSFDDLLINGNCIPTPTTFLRTNLYIEYLKSVCPEEHLWKMGDYPIWLYIARFSLIKCLPQIVGIYRKLEESASHTKNISKKIEFDKSYRDIKLYFNKRYNCDNKRTQRIINYKYLKTLVTLYVTQDKSLRSFIRSESYKLKVSIFQKFVIWCCTLPIVRAPLSYILKGKKS